MHEFYDFELPGSLFFAPSAVSSLSKISFVSFGTKKPFGVFLS